MTQCIIFGDGLYVVSIGILDGLRYLGVADAIMPAQPGTSISPDSIDFGKPDCAILFRDIAAIDRLITDLQNLKEISNE